ncbi:OLC1v1008679C1 [Oldenlandia corymbosa var. corymbosa]|uniref:OLC1v1008679C1 n=1 Tax=Oldenlandia corymbosa var. corymbosa TaxID=529605 RepID=A0AAV1DQ01_OLDCO|nr:OLC1v1008679C1 [Oldenlandia corymbosa var. corymbosa]
MEDQLSVNSPRRTLSFSKNRKVIESFPYPSKTRNDKSTSGFGISGEHGPKSSEVYGFVGSISTVVATVVFLVWAFAPDSWLHSVGISYYPSRYWALAVPAYVTVTVALAIGFYVGLNFMATPPPTSFNTIFDLSSREPVSSSIALTDSDELPIEPISDIAIYKINDIMFNS